MEILEQRTLFAVTAVFIESIGSLSVFGNNAKNNIVISRDATGNILVNGGAVHIVGGSPTVENTELISVFGFGGRDTITLDEAGGALPKAALFGGKGNDTITGGSGNDLLFGQKGNDQLLGKGGDDQLFGGRGNDVLTGGVGTDSAFGDAGDDLMIWNPGEGSDLNEGGAGNDTVEVNGAGVAEAFTVTDVGSRVLFDRVDPGPFSIDIGTSENLVVNAKGGNDTFAATGNLAGLITLKVDGGAGDDTITGANGDDTLIGGDGNDFIDGNGGADTAFMGAGDDFFRWDPGDGSDTVEGQGGRDTMIFNGSGGDELFDTSANGSRVRFFRSAGTITMDLNGVEQIDVNALGGIDTMVVNDVSGTDLKEVNFSLAAIGGGGDGAADSLIVNGTNRDDEIQMVGDASSTTISGLAAIVNVSTVEAADTITVNGLAGDDEIDASALAIASVQNGGAGDDTLIGGTGNDKMSGGAGDDELTGGPGQDDLDGGAGNNVLVQ
jgi:Ca2+-binding RTX toxin-like protein